jgi:hypothetical protein
VWNDGQKRKSVSLPVYDLAKCLQKTGMMCVYVATGNAVSSYFDTKIGDVLTLPLRMA